MSQTEGPGKRKEAYRGLTLDGERALYGLRDAVVEGCTFSGPEDGESALKECSDVLVDGCEFDLRYPLWHNHDLEMRGCRMTETCRAALWYDSDGLISDCRIGGVKALRECDRMRVEGCDIDSSEFGWKCRGIRIRDCSLVSEYPFLDSRGLDVDGLRMRAKYSFQYVSDVRISNSELQTKDAFWHSRDVTVEDTVLKGEYLGWYSENLTLVRCHISGTQPLCYCRGLRLVDCTMDGCDLSFEYSNVDATVIGHVDSVKNPLSGRIRLGSVGEIVHDGSVMGCRCSVETGYERA